MKRTLAITLLLSAIFLSVGLFAQTVTVNDTASNKNDTTLPKIEFGVKVGANFQTITGKVWNHDYKTGIIGGITVGMHKNKVGVRAEVLVGTSSYTSTIPTDSVGNKSNITAISINVPVLFEYTFIPWLTLQVGPQYNNLVSAKDPNNLNQNPKLDFKGSSFSGVLGLEAKLPAHFTVGARYILGLTNINNETLDPSITESWKTSAVQVYIGYSIK